MEKKLARILSSLEFEEHSALCFSGGLDSGILAYLMREYDPILYVVGTENSKDIENAVEISQILDIPIRIIEVNEDDVISGISFIKNIENDITPVEVGFDLPLYFVGKNAREKNIYSGQGADELFGGYKKYIKEPALMDRDFDVLISRTLPRERKIMENFGKKLIVPYLTSDIVNFAKSLDVKYKIRGKNRKWILRETARFLGVPEIIVEREKKAAQYGSGVWKLIKRIAREKNRSLIELINEL